MLSTLNSTLSARGADACPRTPRDKCQSDRGCLMPRTSRQFPHASRRARCPSLSSHPQAQLAHHYCLAICRTMPAGPSASFAATENHHEVSLTRRFYRLEEMHTDPRPLIQVSVKVFLRPLYMEKSAMYSHQATVSESIPSLAARSTVSMPSTIPNGKLLHRPQMAQAYLGVR